MSQSSSKTDIEKNARHQRLLQWVSAALAAGNTAVSQPVLQALSGDAGFRRYFRVMHNQQPLLAVDAPPETEKNHAFCHIAQLFRQHGIHAPKVYAVDYQQGFMLLEDFGDVMYWPLLQQIQKTDVHASEKSTLPLYADATQCLLRMAKIPTADAGLPNYDAEKLQQEMDLFPQWFVKQLLQLEVTSEIAVQLKKINQLLIENAAVQPQVVVHRDFHCRNLMQVVNNNPGVIDFQDAVIGPITYDLVSLYRDCYIFWLPTQVKQWTLDYRQQLIEQKIVENISESEFLKWFDWMGLQRHIKVLGIFARLYLRDNKPGYLKDLPLVIHYTLSVARQYPEFSAFVSWFEQDLLPKARQCDWYSEIIK